MRAWKCAPKNARQKFCRAFLGAHFSARIFYAHNTYARIKKSLFCRRNEFKISKNGQIREKKVFADFAIFGAPGARERAFWRNPDHIVILCSKNALVEKLKNWHLWASNPPPWPGRGTLDPGPFADSYRHCKSKLISFGKVNYTWLWMHALIGMWSEGRKSVPTVMASRQCMRQCSDHCSPATSVA